VAIVGAGLAGLSAAQGLARAGVSVAVLDKGRRPGGRAAHREPRERPDLSFDHGAQYFTARSEPFREQLRDWSARGIAARWEGEIVALGPDGIEAKPGERWVGVPGMHALGRDLAHDLEVRTGVRVHGLRRRHGAWELQTQDGIWPQRFPVVLVTTPPEPAVPLLQAAPSLAEVAGRGVRMLPCWAGMVAWSRRWDVEFDGAFLDSGPLSWIARDSSKPGRPVGDRWVLHAAPDWSRAHFEAEPSEVVAQLVEELTRRVGPIPGVDHLDAHRWAYSQPREPLPRSAYFESAIGLGLAGDWCGGPRVEGAWKSGRSLARQVLDA